MELLSDITQLATFVGTRVPRKHHSLFVVVSAWGLTSFRFLPPVFKRYRSKPYRATQLVRTGFNPTEQSNSPVVDAS